MTDQSRGVEEADAERLLSAVRAVGVVLGIPALLTTPDWPNPVLPVLAWALLGLLAAGTAVIWSLNSRPLPAHRRATLSWAALLFDIVMVSGFVLLFAYEVPAVTWALLIILPFDGALRFGWRGAVVVALVSEAVFLVHAFLGEAMGAIPVTASAHFFVVCLFALLGGITGVLVEVWRRQTAQHRAQADELDRAHRIRDRLMAVTSHEIRGSLAAIGSTASLLEEQRQRLAPERVDRMLGATRRQVEHLLVLVDDLLVTGRGDERGLDLNPVWGDLESTVTLALAAAERSRRGHDLDVTELEPIWCEVDHQRVQQVVRNLVENAFKYSPGGTRVAVMSEGSSTGVVLTVSDEGDGIPEEQQDELFEPFRRGHNADTADGVGLGLYVVSRIVSAAGGTVEVSSQPGDTRFVVSLPCRTDQVGTDVAAARTAAPE